MLDDDADVIKTIEEYSMEDKWNFNLFFYS